MSRSLKLCKLEYPESKGGIQDEKQTLTPDRNRLGDNPQPSIMDVDDRMVLDFTKNVSVNE